jgi:hypothetical protein
MLTFIINGQVCLLCIWIQKFQIITYNNASFDNFDFHNEKIHCTPKMDGAILVVSE